MDQARNAAYEIGKTTVAVAAVSMTGLSDAVSNAVGDSTVGNVLANGALYALSSDVVNYFTENKSLLMEGKYAEYADNVVFLGGLSELGRMTNLNQAAYDAIAGVSPLDAQTNVRLTEGVLVAGGKYLGNMLDEAAVLPPPMRYVRHPVTSLMQ